MYAEPIVERLHSCWVLEDAPILVRACGGVLTDTLVPLRCTSCVLPLSRNHTRPTVSDCRGGLPRHHGCIVLVSGAICGLGPLGSPCLVSGAICGLGPLGSPCLVSGAIWGIGV
jgi:hypothetical protein